MSIRNKLKKIFILFLPRDKYQEYLRKLGVKIGKDCEIYKSVSFDSEPYLITIGNHVRINDGVHFVTHDGGCWILRTCTGKYGDIFADADCFGKINVGNNVHIGTNAIIMPGVSIGNNCIIATGAIVTHDVPDNTIWGGVPARQIETLSEYAEKMKNKFVNTKHMNGGEKKDFLTKYYRLEM